MQAHAPQPFLRNNDFLLAEDAVLVLQLPDERLVDTAGQGRQHAALGQRAGQHLLHGDGARHADQARHGRVAAGRGAAVGAQRRRARLPRAVGQLDAEAVLQHNQVALARLELHLALERRAQRVERVAARRRRLGPRQEAQPAQARQDTRLFVRVPEAGLLRDGRDEVRLGRRRRPDDLPGRLVPGQSRLEEGLLGVVQEADVDEDLDEFGEAGVAQGAPRPTSASLAAGLLGVPIQTYLMMVCASGILYRSLYGVESRFGYATKAKPRQ